MEVVSKSISIVNYTKNIYLKFLSAVVTFFSQLPNIVWQYLLNVISFINNWGNTVVSKVRSAGSNFLNGVIIYIKLLLGHVAIYIISTTHKLVVVLLYGLVMLVQRFQVL